MAANAAELIREMTKFKKSLYHFTDKRNLESIREYGILSMRSLREREIKTHPGGNQISLEADTRFGMDGYVHMSFRDRHHMIVHAKERGQSIVELEIKPEAILLPNAAITLDVANKGGVIPLPVDEAVLQMDLDPILKYMDWKDPEIKPRIQTTSRYELIVPNHLPVEYIKF
jgi:hypothetical protein